ncbi:MAG: polyprenyl synthetase family protein [Acidobacteriia bacterium]|nr:polyprenyl synthetase family protein [Terriglobia bacterium]
MTVDEIFELVKGDLEQVEQEFGRQVASPIETISSIGSYLQQSGGKRLRPALLLLCARLCGSNGNLSSIRLGAVVEFIHTATLVHDDIIDGADLRRGRASANSKWGNQTCVLTGDWLYMQSYAMALGERNFRVLEILTEVTQKMVEGELIQLHWLGRSDIDEDSYYDIASRKTSYLFAACGRLGAVLGGRPARDEETMGEFGRLLGLAFQVVDDLLDFTSNEKVLGKPVLSDLKEGKVTLPLIYALAKSTDRERAVVEGVLSNREMDESHRKQVLDLVRKYDTLPMVRHKALELAQEARKRLATFPDSTYKQALTEMTHLVVDRDH